MSKYLIFPFELLFFGLVFAKHRFNARCDAPLDPERLWDRCVTPRSPVTRFIEASWPPKPLIALGLLVLRRTPYFTMPSLGIEHHYDISNEFFALFLDREYMFYSFADFHSDDETLEDAQENKANFILDLIDPKPGQRILDLGCGWGSMMKKVVSVTGDRENIRGYTLSRKQHEHVEKLGFDVALEDLMTLEIPEASCDRIYSIGAIEHIRKAELLPFSKKLRRAIKPDGHVVHHFFCQQGNVPPPELIVLLDIFPGSLLAAFDHHRKIFEEAGFRIAHHSIHDYRPTLRAWFDRLVANKDHAITLLGPRNYNRHLSYFAYSYRLFNEGHLIPNRYKLKPTP
jgi:cyclopropane-fatty-acyl-phospholipid synthase